MMVKASIVQIYSAADSHFIIYHIHLRMAKPRSPLVYPHSISCKTVVERAGYLIYQLFIRYAGSYYPHIHSTLGCKGDCLAHLICNYQIRSHKVAVFLRLICHAYIDIFAHLFFIYRNISIRLYKGLTLCHIVSPWKIFFDVNIILVRALYCIPHL